ncbi:Major Facilitator Superfamily protein [Geodermatophilus dictyosporus]|uniref:Major Facilitator Superfamily protein n=1 Tax=Geodermatophilus dictyosporus TaxID=1523247 RepID=A0A1I5LWP7_9ACTN|nr:Major Facilitator Superfamily protein [Geodermatophilus dictyosporus]
MSSPAPTRPALLVLALSLGVTTLSLLQSLVVPVLGPIGEQLGVSTAAAGWVLTANLLAAAVLTPVLGRLGDTHGERPVILGILAAVALGTLLAVVTRSLPLLLVARVLQGASYGLFPLSISVLRRELPPGRLSVAMSVVSSTLGVGGVVGLVAAGLLTGDGGDYRRPFWIGLGVTLVSLVLAAVLLPRRPATATGRVDWAGAAVLGVGLVLLLLPVSQGNAWGWTSPGTLGCAAGAAVVLTGWVLLQRRRAQPLVRPALLTDPRMLVPNLAGLTTGVGLFVSFLVVMQYVQTPPEAGYGFGAGVLEAAVVYLLPGGVVGILLAPVAGTIVDRLGALPTLLAGAAAGIAGFAVFAVARAEPWLVVTAGLLAQVWVTVVYAALPTLVVQAVRRSETGVANAVNSIARAVGQAVGSTLTVALLGAAVDPATGFPRASAFTAVALLGAASAVAVALVSVVGMVQARRRGPGEPDGDAADVERATACAGEWSPVSGIR